LGFSLKNLANFLLSSGRPGHGRDNNQNKLSFIMFPVGMPVQGGDFESQVGRADP